MVGWPQQQSQLLRSQPRWVQTAYRDFLKWFCNKSAHKAIHMKRLCFPHSVD